MVPVCQMVSCVTRNGPDTFSDASWTETAAVDGQDMDDFYQWAVSSDEEDFVIPDVGSIADVSWNMSEEEELINSDVESIVDVEVIIRRWIFVVIRTWDLWQILNRTLGTTRVPWTFRMHLVHFRRVCL